MSDERLLLRGDIDRLIFRKLIIDNQKLVYDFHICFLGYFLEQNYDDALDSLCKNSPYLKEEAGLLSHGIRPQYLSDFSLETIFRKYSELRQFSKCFYRKHTLLDVDDFIIYFHFIVSNKAKTDDSREEEINDDMDEEYLEPENENNGIDSLEIVPDEEEIENNLRQLYEEVSELQSEVKKNDAKQNVKTEVSHPKLHSENSRKFRAIDLGTIPEKSTDHLRFRSKLADNDGEAGIQVLDTIPEEDENVENNLQKLVVRVSQANKNHSKEDKVAEHSKYISLSEKKLRIIRKLTENNLREVESLRKRNAKQKMNPKEWINRPLIDVKESKVLLKRLNPKYLKYFVTKGHATDKMIKTNRGRHIKSPLKCCSD